MTEEGTAAEVEGRVTALLLKQIAAALLAKGLLHEMDVAGALLRMEAQAGFADDAEREYGAITSIHAEGAALAIAEWERDLGLKPSLYVLRQQAQAWREDARQKHPYDQDRIALLRGDG